MRRAVTTVAGIGDGTEVGERADLPTEAYQALVALNLSAFRQGPVYYDR